MDAPATDTHGPSPSAVWVLAPGGSPTAADEGLASGLLLAGLGPEGSARLTADLAEMATRLEARHHPLVIDLIGDDLAGDAEAMVRRWLPSRAAARALSLGRWTGPGGVVYVADHCPAEARCLPLDAAPLDLPLAAWPITHSRRLRFAEPAHAARVAASLRAHLATNESPLALVLTAGPPSPVDPEMVRHIRRLLRRLPAEDGRLRRFVRGMAAPTPGPRPPWWPEPDEVVVVPRLAALADAQAIDEVLATAIRRSAVKPRR